MATTKLTTPTGTPGSMPTAASRHTFRRAYARAIVATFAPLAITVYFWVIWRLYLDPSDDDANGLVFGQPGANAIYYSWFVVATLGLTLFQYGLDGIEGSMLSQPKWAAMDATRFKDYSRLHGWLRVLRRYIFRRRATNYQPNISRQTTLIWTLPGVITLLGYVGLPLSGLAMNFGTGYYAANDNPTMIGFNNASWNSRFKFDVTQRAFLDWKTNAPVSIPGSGVIYSTPDVDRGSLPVLASLPNTLPNDTGVSHLFMAPQAGTPVDGRSWGLAFGYQCSVVTSLSDFTILNHRKSSANFSSTGTPVGGYSVLGGNATINIYNETNSAFAANIQAVAEMGYDDAGQTAQEAASPPAASECYNPIPLPGPNGESMPYPGLDQPQVLEFVLWQNLTTRASVVDPPVFDLSLPDTIPELFGAYKTYDSFNITPPYPMAAIGVRCTSVSAVGTAQLDGRRATFDDFQRSDSTQQAPSHSGLQCAERLSLGVPNLAFANTLSGSSSDWLSSFFSSVGKFQQDYSEVDYEFGGNAVTLQSSYLQADELRRSLTRAYALYSLELMYNNGVGYVDANGSYHVQSEFTNAQAAGYTQDNILVPGIVPPVVAAILLAFWSLGSLILALLYGFRRQKTA